MRFFIYLMGKLKVPMIGYARQKVLVMNDETVELKIPLSRRTKNHLNSMYFGALAIGADLAGGAHAFYYAKKDKVKISFAFKDFKADFIKRPETDVIFRSNDGLLIGEALEHSKKTGERINQPISVTAYNLSNEVVAEFVLTASIKCYMPNNK